MDGQSGFWTFWVEIWVRGGVEGPVEVEVEVGVEVGVGSVPRVRKSQILTFLRQNFIHFSRIFGVFDHFHFSGGPKLARFASVWSVEVFRKNGKMNGIGQKEPNSTLSES